MGQGTIGKSDGIEYSTPLGLIEPLIKEFNLITDVCASDKNHKLPKYWTKEDNALNKAWEGNCWMNPPFSRDLNKWVRKACNDARKYKGVKVCLVPVRSNTKWWDEVTQFAEIRFINGEVNFNDEERGLWLPMCIMIFGEKANVGTFSTINYREIRAKKNYDCDLFRDTAD